MPKQIKKEQIKKSELLYRKWSVAGLAAAAVFMGCMAGLMSMIVKTEGAKVPTIVLFAAFIIYTAVSVVCAVLGVKSYVKDDCGVCLFQGIVHIYSVIACVMNVRMAFIILFSALGSQSGVDTLIGSQSQNEFIQSQYASCVMLFGLHRMDSYPMDVWINRMIDDVYHGNFDPSQYAGFAGYVQQLQFFYYRKTAKEESV